MSHNCFDILWNDILSMNLLHIITCENGESIELSKMAEHFLKYISTPSTSKFVEKIVS